MNTATRKVPQSSAEIMWLSKMTLGERLIDKDETSERGSRGREHSSSRVQEECATQERPQHSACVSRAKTE